MAAEYREIYYSHAGEARGSMLVRNDFLANILTMAENMTLLSVQNPLKMFIGIFTGLYCTWEMAWFFYNVCFDYNVDYVMSFGPMTFNNVHAAIIIFQNYSKYSSFKKGVEIIKENCWEIDEAQPEAGKSILLDMKMMKLVMVVSLGLVLCTPVVYLPFNGVHYNDTLFITVHWLGHVDVPAPLEYFLIILNNLRLVPQGYFMLSYLFSLSYFINHYRYQIIMVKWELLNITKFLAISDDEVAMVDSKECQRIIKRRLEACIKHHIFLCTYAEYIIKHFYYTIIWQIFSGMILFTSLVYIFLFHDAANNPVAIGTNIIGAYFAAFLYTAYGELFQNQTDILLDAAGACNWHCFDSSNRKTMLIFMINLKRQYKIVGLGIIVLNLEMFVWFSNKIVGLLSVVSLMEE